MKINMPVTNTEIIFDDTQFMLTKTDLKGAITYANKDFIEVSGFSEAELVGQNHNMVRHPDMPVEAFEDMWRSLKAGKPWTGLVKNRTKSGDFYWVEANATPVVENGQVTGFLSVRRKPSRQQVEEATAAYRLFKDGQAKGLTILEGKVVKSSTFNKFKNKLSNITVSQRMLGIVGIAVAVVALQAGIGLYELSQSNKSLQTIYQDRMKPVNQLNHIDDNIRAAMKVVDVVISEAKPVEIGKTTTMVIDAASANKGVADIENALKEVKSTWQAYIATYLTPEEKSLVAQYEKDFNQLIQSSLEPTVEAMKKRDYAAVKAADVNTEELYLKVGAESEKLIGLQFKIAEDLDKQAATSFENVRILTFAGLAFAVVFLSWLGFLISRSITKPLEKSISAFGQITEGNYSTAIDANGNNELSKVLQALKTMQTLLSVKENELKENATNTLEQSTQYENQLAAISKSTGVIEFSMDGKVIAANDIFLNVLGYSREEAIGQHHSAFVEPEYKASPEYIQFWEKLNRGQAITGQFVRVGKSGKEIWLEASYNPILCAAGKPYKVVKYATDITEQKLKNADFEGQMTAIGKSQGVIEVCLDGIITKVNQVYLDMLGYTEKELLGNHVSMVLDPTFAKSEAYKALWGKLVNGGTDTGQYKRIAKNGREVWIQASYNPIYDLKGKPFKIVNFTMDITAAKLQAADNAGQLTAINKIQGVIEFDLTGKITAVNENFANVTGYSEKEIVGNHHSMFVDAAYKSSHEYKAFWDKLNQR